MTEEEQRSHELRLKTIRSFELVLRSSVEFVAELQKTRIAITRARKLARMEASNPVALAIKNEEKRVVSVGYVA